MNKPLFVPERRGTELKIMTMTMMMNRRQLFVCSLSPLLFLSFPVANGNGREILNEQKREDVDEIMKFLFFGGKDI